MPRFPTGGIRLAVVIPAYRAQHTIAEVLEQIPDFVSVVVVVDDCSPDETSQVVARCAEFDSRIHLVRHSVNQGVGGATLTGYAHAAQLGAEVLVKMDSDGQMDPEQLVPLVAPLLAGQADYAKGCRLVDARELQRMPALRRIGNLGLSFLTKLASGYWNICDPTNGYTAIDAGLVPLLESRAIDRRYFFESSMLLELGRVGAVVRDINMPARYNGETSHLSEWRALRDFPPRLARGFFRRLWTQYFLRDFNAATLFLLSGAASTLFGSVFGAFHWWRSVVSQSPATTGTVMLAVLAIILGVQFLLQGLVLDIHGVPSQPLQILANRRELEEMRQQLAVYRRQRLAG